MLYLTAANTQLRKEQLGREVKSHGWSEAEPLPDSPPADIFFDLGAAAIKQRLPALHQHVTSSPCEQRLNCANVELPLERTSMRSCYSAPDYNPRLQPNVHQLLIGLGVR